MVKQAIIKMKKICKILFLLSLMAFPFIFSACERDYGETNYNNVDDDDWKKKNVVFVDSTGDGLSTVNYTEL